MRDYAFVVGALELLLCLPLVFRPAQGAAWLQKTLADEVVPRITGAAFVVMSVGVLAADTRIGIDVAGLVRLVAWVAGAKGLIWCWWPGKAREWMGDWLVLPATLPVFGLVGTAIGALLIAAGVALS